MKIQQNAVADQDLEKLVIDYLKSHPGFFERNRTLLAEMKVPHQSAGNAISLIERQVGLLREQNAGLRKQLQHLVEIARENDMLNMRLNHLTQAVLTVDSKSGMATLLSKLLHDEFDADTVCVHLFENDANNEDEALVGQWDELAKLLVKKSVRCGELTTEQGELLFGEMAESVASAAMVSLGVHGILAIGSHDHDRFHADISTDYLQQMGSVIEAVLGRIH